MGLAPFPVEYLDLPDDQLGMHVFDWWACYQAERRGIPPSEVTKEMVEEIRVATVGMDSNDVRVIPLEKALRRVAIGDAAGGGKLFRALMHDGAVTMTLDGLADQAILRKRQVSEWAKKGNVKRRKYEAADRKRWRELAAAPDMKRFSKKRKAEIIAQREGLPREASESIRKAL